MSGHEQGITWLASFPKSGNTWLRLFLTAYLNDGKAMNFNILPRQMNVTDNSVNDYFVVSPAPVHLLSHYEMLLIRGAVLVKLIRERSSRPLLVKTHNANSILDGVRLIPPQITSKAVYIFRDPRDVAVSLAKWTENTIDDTIEGMGNESMILHNDTEWANTIFHFISSWSKHVESWIDEDIDTLFVKYEDMLADPERVFSKVVEHIGWKYRKNQLKSAMKAVEFNKLKKFEDKHGFAERPPTVDRFFNSGQSGGWKTFLTSEQSAKIESDHGDVMRRFGYL